MSKPDEPCMSPDGCDREATRIVLRPDHWHDDVFCDEHAPKNAAPMRALNCTAAGCSTRTGHVCEARP